MQLAQCGRVRRNERAQSGTESKRLATRLPANVVGVKV
jgi:hypothetical protein